MSIETRQPDIPAQRTSIEHSRVEKARYIGQLAWMHDLLVFALQNGDVDTAQEMRHMIESASQ